MKHLFRLAFIVLFLCLISFAVCLYLRFHTFGKLIALLLCSVAAGVTLTALSAKDPPRLPVRLLICLMLMAVYGLCFPLARIF